MTRWTQSQVDAHQAKVKRKQPEQEGAAIDSMRVKDKPMIWISRYDITPIGKPRITARGKYGPVARKYYEFAEKLRSLNMEIPQSGTEIQFFIPMPISWSKKKKRELPFTIRLKDFVVERHSSLAVTVLCLMPYIRTTRGFGVLRLKSFGPIMDLFWL